MLSFVRGYHSLCSLEALFDESGDPGDTEVLVKEVSGASQCALQDIFHIWTVADFLKFKKRDKYDIVDILIKGKCQTSTWFMRIFFLGTHGDNHDILRLQIKDNFKISLHEILGTRLCRLQGRAASIACSTGREQHQEYTQAWQREDQSASRCSPSL